MSDGDRVIVGEDGSIRVGRRAERRLRDRAGEYRLTVEAPGLLILRRRDHTDQAGTGTRVIMSGEILSRMTVLEIINVIANASWRGILHVHGEEGRHRALTFDQGALKFARSNDPDDRLGEVLYRQGVLSRSQLDDLLRRVTPEKRFGQLVVEEGLLEQDQLFEHLRSQAEQIFYGTLLEHEGIYVFCTPEESGPPPAHTVHLPVQGLLMEGVQRIDEMALFRERIQSSQLCPDLRPGAMRKSVDGEAMTVLAYCDGSRTIEDIARETGLGEFHTTKTIYHLLQQGIVELHPPRTLDTGEVRRLVGLFNDVMRDIFVAVATYGGVQQTRDTLSSWIQGSGYAAYFGNEVSEDGTIDPVFVVDALSHTESDRPLEALHQALHELAAFALFSATTTLPRDQELILARDVNQRLKRIRLE